MPEWFYDVHRDKKSRRISNQSSTFTWLGISSLTIISITYFILFEIMSRYIVNPFWFFVYLAVQSLAFVGVMILGYDRLDLKFLVPRPYRLWGDAIEVDTWTIVHIVLVLRIFLYLHRVCVYPFAFTMFVMAGWELAEVIAAKLFGFESFGETWADTTNDIIIPAIVCLLVQFLFL